jgi:hypothetical protein
VRRARSAGVFALGLALVGAAGCARHVVVDPENVRLMNDRAWTVTSEPGRVPVTTVDGGPAPPTEDASAPH